MSWFTRTFTGLLLLIILTSSTAWATEVDVNGQVRFRLHGDDKDFNITGGQVFSELRSRVGIAVAPQENLKLFVQFQDSRLVGSNSGGLGADANVGLHQGYFKFGIGRGWSVQAGRFQMVYGNQRLVGAVGWHNVGRTWDGLRLKKDSDTWYLDWFGTQLNENAFATDYPDKDRQFTGLNFRLKDKNVEVFAYGDFNRTPGEGFVNRQDTRGTAGAYSARTFGGNFDYIFNGAYQLGKQKSTTVADTLGVRTTTEKDVAAYMVSLETGYTFEEERKARVAVLFDYASGDGDPGDGDFKAFDNLYYTGHKFRGFMDYFLASNSLGLMDAVLRAKVAATGKWTLKADFHMFRAAQEFSDTTTSPTSTIGNELDLTAEFKDGMFTFVFGVSAFMAADESHIYASNLVGGETATWSYVMCTASF